MRLRPPEFIVDPKRPCAHDRLGREPRVEALCNVLARVEGSAVVSVDGGFGSGKTAFLKMCAATLRLRGVFVVEFDAWRQGHTGEPLVDLVSALMQRSSKTAERLKRVAVGLAWRLAGAATSGLVARDDHVENGDASEFDRWVDIDERKSEFKKLLAEMVMANDDRVVLFIDELDRCLPEHAVGMLSVARDLLDVPGVVIVLGVNHSELCHRVRSVHGAGCDAEMYLRRFVDLPVDLGAVDAAQLDRFLDGSFEAAGMLDRFTSSEGWFLSEMIKLLAQQAGMSLRDIEQVVHRAALTLGSIAEPKSEVEREQAVLTMMVLREVDRSAYDRFTAGQCDAFDAARALQQAMTAKASDPMGWETAGRRMVAILMLLTNEGGLAAADTNENDFVRRFVDAGLGNAVRATEAFNTSPLTSASWKDQDLSIGNLAGVIELFA